MTACLMHPFEKCVGIELLDSLYKSSVEMKSVYDQYCESLSSNPEII